MLITPVRPGALSPCVFDQADADEVAARMAARARNYPGPAAGDWVELHDRSLYRLADTGRLARHPKFARNPHDFYLESDGLMNYGHSGWERGVPLEVLRRTGQTLPGRAQMLHVGPGRTRTVAFTLDLPVWRCPRLRHQ
ncbi:MULTISPECIES: hypothetical protein [unclassified Nocardia]|uniref:hypothetical protein n=1 Tax=unclassified Nocardia TaxID=2637762 RepID=UPI00278BD194|nr:MULTISPECIES: hypothetical protein [unclassified Nocardia]